MLASDVNNPDFVGVSRPDDALYVRFEMYESEDWNKTQETGRKVKLPAKPYIFIQAAGDKTTVIHRPVDDNDKARFPREWLAFQLQEGLIGSEASIPGWKIEEWDYLNPEQVRDLRYMRFEVVEQIAGASDAQTQRMGMGGSALREAARRALRERMGAETKAELAKKDAEIAEMKERMAKLEAALFSKPVETAQPVEAPAPKRRGRPKKVKPEQVSA